MKKIIIAVVFCVISFTFFIILNINTNTFYISQVSSNILILPNIQIIDSKLEKSAVFCSGEIPNNIYEKMLGNSIPFEYKNQVDLSLFSYLKLSYFGFDGESHIGEMIVNKKVSNDVLEIFKELYDIKYPIAKIRLIDEYNADDELSMADNNTSCFCFRVVSGSKKLSNHAKRNSNRYKSFI